MQTPILSFFCPCIPPTTTAQMKRACRTGTGIRFFKSKEQERAEGTLHSVLLPHQPGAPVTGIVALQIEATWPWRKSDLSTKAKRSTAEQSGRQPFGGKPDADNFCKAFMDALVALRFIERDQYVADLTVRKWVGTTPGISVRIARPT